MAVYYRVIDVHCLISFTGVSTSNFVVNEENVVVGDEDFEDPVPDSNEAADSNPVVPKLNPMVPIPPLGLVRKINNSSLKRESLMKYQKK